MLQPKFQNKRLVKHHFPLLVTLCTILIRLAENFPDFFLSFLTINGIFDNVLISKIEDGYHSGYQYAASRPWNKIWQKHRYKSRFMVWMEAMRSLAGLFTTINLWRHTLNQRHIMQLYFKFSSTFWDTPLYASAEIFQLNTEFCKLAVDSHTELCLRWELDSFIRNLF